MSNYSRFFPEGDTNIKRNPNDLPIFAFQNTGSGQEQYIFYSPSANSSTGTYNAGSSSNCLLGTSSSFAANAAKATLSANTETTIVNVSGGGGYLCNVISARNDQSQGASQGLIEITIILDGTTYTYSLNYDNATNTTRAHRVFWGYADTGSFFSYNQPDDTTAVGLGGFGGQIVHRADRFTTLPPYYYVVGEFNQSVRIFSPIEFKKFNLPRLRFNSSLVVKVKNETLTSNGDTYDNDAAASYYLDTQIM